MDPRPSEFAIDPAHLDLDAFRGRRVVVLGLARSGIALARFLVDRDALVTVYDARPAEQLGDAIIALEGRPVELRLGPEIDPARILEASELILTSPSVNAHFPTTEPRLRAALTAIEGRGAPAVISEVELFMRLSPATVIGVTGTKGKTTTSTLTAAILAEGQAPVELGGNIGRPLIDRVPELTPDHRVVLELSELQLPTLSRGPLVSVYTHVTADHLDRHGSVAAYRRVKQRLAELTQPDGRVVLNAEDRVSIGFSAVTRASTVTYRRGLPTPGGVGIADDWIIADRLQPLDPALPPRTGRIVPLSEIVVPGWHNVSNVLAATAVGLLFDIDPAAIRRAVRGFHGVEHRLETVALVEGVRFVNDSQGTQPDAVIAALRSFDAPLVLIAGGRAKDVAMDELVEVAVERADAVVLIGESGPALGEALRAAGHPSVEVADRLAVAVPRANAIARELLTARPGAGPTDVATVLLSPAAASFDQFIDYAARGAAFKASVAEIVAAGPDREGSD